MLERFCEMQKDHFFGSWAVYQHCEMQEKEKIFGSWALYMKQEFFVCDLKL